MALQFRNMLLNRRTSGIADLSNFSISDGNIAVEAAETEGLLKVNCSHQVGIATQTEVGLSPARFPIRVVIIDPKINRAAHRTDTVCRYWAIKHADGTAVPYSRKPVVNNLCIKNLYAHTADLDSMLWTNYRAVKEAKGTGGIVEAWSTMSDNLYALLQTINPNDEQGRMIGELVGDILYESLMANSYAYFRIGDNAYLVAVPHGYDYSQLHSLSAHKVAICEGALTLKVNYDRLKAKYDTLSDGVITMAANSIMMMFRHGIVETYESQEFYTVEVSVNSNTSYSVEMIHAPAGAGNLSGLSIGDTIDISAVRFSKQVIEVANLVVMSSGLMHYLFNHTTGGTQVNGTLLTTLAMFNYISANTSIDEHIQITNLLYEALHPVNKRAVANIFFARSNVTTHGRSSSNRKYEELSVDSFFHIRCNPYPAGSHKAFICLTAMKRVLQAGLGPFLPWADQLNECINTCKDVLTSGARAHIGSFYYTGDPPLVQPSSLDQYLPELAMYVQTFNKGDSLTLSPHLSVEIANRSPMNWQSLLKDLKAKDISATSSDVVRSFLATSGAVNFTFDPADQSTWAQAAADASVAQKAIAAVFD